MIPIQIYRFGGVFEGVIKSLDDRHTLLTMKLNMPIARLITQIGKNTPLTNGEGKWTASKASCGLKDPSAERSTNNPKTRRFPALGLVLGFLGNMVIKSGVIPRASSLVGSSGPMGCVSRNKLESFYLLTVSSGVRKDGCNVSDIGHYVWSFSSNIFPGPL